MHQYDTESATRQSPNAEPNRSLEEVARDIQDAAAKNQAEDGPNTRRGAVRACKYLGVMVNKHGPQLQVVYDAAKIHGQRSKGTAPADANRYRPRKGELPVVQRRPA